MNNKSTTPLRRFTAAAVVGLLFGAGTGNVNAAVRTWTGAGGPPYNWSDPNNWGGTAPSSGDDLVFDGTVGLTNVNDFSGAQWLSITFAPTAGQFLLQGNSMQMGTGGNAGFTNNSAYVQTIDIETRNNRTCYYDTTGASMEFTKRLWDWRYYKVGPNDLILRQTLDGYNGQILGIDEGRVIANSVATNGGPWGHGVQINSGGTLVTLGPTVSFNTDYRADVTMSGGLWQVQNTNELGEPYYERTCMLRSSDASSIVENGSALGPVQLQIGEGSAARVGAFDGMIQDGAGGGALALRLVNSGTYSYWRLGGTNSYSGDTEVIATGNANGTSETRLIINGSNAGGGNYSVDGDADGNKAYLGGAGTIEAGTVNVGTNGVLSPGGDLEGSALYSHQGGGSANSGTFAESTAVFTVNGAVNLTDSSSMLDAHVGGTTPGAGYDQLDIAGTGSFSNNAADLQLTFDVGFTPMEGDQFTLVQVQGTDPANNIGVFGTLNGTAADLSQGATNTLGATRFRISYHAEGTTFDAGASGNDIMIEILPTTAQKLTWTGSVNNNWDLSGTANWDKGGVSALFSNLDYVTFSDTASTYDVNLTTALNPTLITVDASHDYLFEGAGNLTGSVVMNKTNSGRLIVATENDNSGTTTIDQGVVQMGRNDTAGTVSGNLVINPGGVFDHDRSDDQVLGNASGSGAIVHSGDGALTVATDLHAFTGFLTNTGGPLQIGDGTSGNAATIGATVVLPGSAQLSYNFNGGGNVTLANSLSGTGTATYSFTDNPRTFTFAGTVTNSGFSGMTDIKVNTRVEVTTADASPAGPITVESGGLTPDISNDGAYYTHVSGFTNQNSITIAGYGPASPVDTPRGKGALRLGNTWAGPITLSANATIGGSGTGTVIGNISDGGNNYTLEFIGGTIQVGPATGVNTYGQTVINEDYYGSFAAPTLTTVRALNSNPFGSGAIMMVGRSRLELNGNSLSIANLGDIPALAGSNYPPVVVNNSTAGAATLTIGTDNNDGLFTGQFIDGSSQPLGVTKAGTGTLTLSGDSTSTGTVSVDAGTLRLAMASGTYFNGDPILGSGSFSNATAFAVATGATLDVSGRSDGTLTLNANQTLKHSGTSTGPIAVTGNVNIGSGALLLAINRAGLAHDSLAASGSTTYSGTLAVTNIGAALQVGDPFQLFPSGVSGFTAYNLQTADVVNNVKYTWDNTVSTDGKITVASVSTLVNSTPTNIVFSASDGTLDLSWPEDHIGWTLQTNAVSVADSAAWFDYPADTGSRNTNHVTYSVDSTKTNVFFRLVY